MVEVVQLVSMILFCNSDQRNQWILSLNLPLPRLLLQTSKVGELCRIDLPSPSSMSQNSETSVLRWIDMPLTSVQALNRWLSRSHVPRFVLMGQVIAGPIRTCVWLLKDVLISERTVRARKTLTWRRIGDWNLVSGFRRVSHMHVQARADRTGACLSVAPGVLSQQASRTDAGIAARTQGAGVFERGWMMGK